VAGGERLLAVDDRPIRALADVQAAIREHQIGEEVRFSIQRGGSAPREVIVRHVGDYPPTG
jgi:S1-C subfamily serine protease